MKKESIKGNFSFFAVNKKGMTQKVVMELILTLVAIFVLIQMIIHFVNQANPTDYLACSESIDMAEKFNDPTLIKCPYQETTINGNKDEILNQLIDEIYECWEKFGEGKEITIITLNDPLLSKEGESISFCHICSIINFNETISFTKDEIIERAYNLYHDQEFLDYLRNNHLNLSEEYDINNNEKLAVYYAVLSKIEAETVGKIRNDLVIKYNYSTFISLNKNYDFCTIQIETLR